MNFLFPVNLVPIQEFVYNEAENRAENVADFLPGACILLFGQASEKSSKGNYCICKETIAFPRNDNKYCRKLNFELNIGITRIFSRLLY